MKSAITRLFTVVGFGALGLVAAPAGSPPQERKITVHARKYAYEPDVIHVNRGDTVRLRLVSEDVVHGFFLEGYDLDAVIVPMRSTVEVRRPSQPNKSEKLEEIVFTANSEGKFRYRCSQTCGFMHPFMLGEMIVGPNRLVFVSLGLAVGMLLAGLLVPSSRRKTA